MTDTFELLRSFSIAVSICELLVMIQMHNDPLPELAQSGEGIHTSLINRSSALVTFDIL